MVPRAAAHQFLHHRSVRIVVTSVPAGRPADHFELVIVAVPDDIPAGVSQPAYDRLVPGRRSPVHRCCVIPFLQRVHIQAT